jgi:hypothetical protein
MVAFFHIDIELIKLPPIQTIFRLILITWEAAVPPSTCAIAVLIAGAIGVRVTFLSF